MTYTDRSAISASTPEPTKFLRKGVAALALATAWIVLLALFQIAPAGAQSGGGHTGSCVFAGVKVSTGLPESECEGLDALYHRTDGPGWTLYPWHTPWMQPVDPCDWSGVSCTGAPSDKIRHVRQIQLGGRGLSGELPDEIALFTQLWELNLEHNDLSGEIPASLSLLPELHLAWLSHNSFSGEIPPELGDLANIWTLDLDNNKLEGSIPGELMGNDALAYLRLRNNGLSGQIPAAIRDATNLRGLWTTGNEMGGRIPDEIIDATMLGASGYGNVQIFSVTNCYHASDEVMKHLEPRLGPWQMPRVFC